MALLMSDCIVFAETAASVLLIKRWTAGASKSTSVTYLSIVMTRGNILRNQSKKFKITIFETDIYYFDPVLDLVHSLI